MRLSLFKQIYIFTFSSSCILALLVTSILWSYQKIEVAYRQDNYAEQLSTHASSLRLLLFKDNIFSAQYDQAQWQQSHEKLNQLFANAPELSPKLQTLQNSIQSQHEGVQRLFEQINKNKLSLANKAIKQHLHLKLITLIDVISADAKQLSAIAHKNIKTVVKQQLSFILLVLLLGIVCLVFGAIKLINIFKISHAEIKKAFQDNYSGDFKEITLSNHYEEFDSIALEFNKMLNKLNDTSVSLEERTQLLEQLSNSDPLTEVANRRHLFKKGAIEFSRAKRNNSMLTVVLLDCDHFKKINDQYGHLFGDEVLKHICKLCQQEIRAVDCLARFGGEEFVIILPECDLDGGIELAKRIQHALNEKPLAFENDNVLVTLSVGICALDNEFNSFEELMNCADHAMYQAKKNGRNRIEICQPLQ